MYFILYSINTLINIYTGKILFTHIHTRALSVHVLYYVYHVLCYIIPKPYTTAVVPVIHDDCPSPYIHNIISISICNVHVYTEGSNGFQKNAENDLVRFYSTRVDSKTKYLYTLYLLFCDCGSFKCTYGWYYPVRSAVIGPRFIHPLRICLYFTTLHNDRILGFHNIFGIVVSSNLQDVYNYRFPIPLTILDITRDNYRSFKALGPQFTLSSHSKTRGRLDLSAAAASIKQ